VKTILLILYFIYCVLVLPVFGENQNIDEINDLLTKEKSELSKLKLKIKKQTRTLSKMGEKKQSILKKQRILDDQLKVREKELNIYNWNLKINKNMIKRLTINIKKTKSKLDSQRISMANRLRTIYKEGTMYPVKILFSSDGFVDLLARVEYMERIAAYDSELFNNYDDQINEFNHKKEDLLNAKGKLLRFKDSAEKKKKQIVAEKFQKKQFLVRLSKEKKINERLKGELVKASKNLNQLIARLEKKQILGEGLDISDKKGRLHLPVNGKILNSFGRQRDKQYDTYIVHNGVNIRSSKGAPVRAVFEGKTLYTGTLEGYGNIVIIGHGKEYHSLYGHLDEIITKVGKAVRLGQIIGRSGDTGSILGESLYFEMRHKGSPIEPTAWLNQSKK